MHNTSLKYSILIVIYLYLLPLTFKDKNLKALYPQMDANER